MVLTSVRRFLEIGLAAYIVVVVGLAAAAKAAPEMGFGLYAVRSASMTPAIGVGDLVVAERVDPGRIGPGDVITFTAGKGATVTHRVVAVSSNGDGLVFTTRGDANPFPDPLASTAAQVRGRVAWAVPALGFLLAMATVPMGVLALLSIDATLLTAVWILGEAQFQEEEDELERLAHGLGVGQAARS